MSETAVRTRRRVVVDQRELARAIGTRIRSARLAAGLTQQELAGERYTKAYISALELGHAKPSMAALDYLAPRLGTRPDRLLTDDDDRWTRIDADLHLAAGRFEQALEAFHTLAAREQDPLRRGELLLGAGEAVCKLRRPEEAAGVLEEAHRLLVGSNRTAELRRILYWQAAVHTFVDDPDVARRMLLDLLASLSADGGDPDLDVRARIALAQVEHEHGSADRARIYLEEASGLVERLDARRRAAYFDGLAKVRSAAGDYEAAVRAGTTALGLFREVDFELQAAALENELALTLIAMDAPDRAEELVTSAIATLERLESWALLGHALDTLATVRLRRGDAAGALALVDRSLELEAEHGPDLDQVGARITRAKAFEALGEVDAAEQAWLVAIEAARRIPSVNRRRRILTARAEALAAKGRHAEAYEVMREAV
jgi:transcriptional regulator with XRE-family HTH domain